MATRHLRVRVHIEPPPKDPDREPPPGRPSRDLGLARRRALVLHTVSDLRDHHVATFYREVLDGRVIQEGVALADGLDPAMAAGIRRWAKAQRPDLGPGMVAAFRVLSAYQLNRLIISRSYRYGVPLVGWALPWQLGRLAGHVGQSVGDSFSVTLAGCGVVRRGRWKDSKYCPRLRMTTRGGGGAGAFLQWLPPRDESSQRRGAPPSFVDVSVLAGAVCGGELTGPDQAASLLEVTWPNGEEGRWDAERAVGAAMVDLYSAACRRLQELAPGLPAHRAWSAGSIVSHMRRKAHLQPAAEVLASLGITTQGAIAAAFLGPPISASLVGIASPMAQVDLNATFPSCFTALDLTRFLIAERIEVEDATEEFEAFLRQPDLEARLFDPEVVRYWGPALVVVAFSDGAVLPTTVEWSPQRTKGTVAPLSFTQCPGLPWFWPDVAHAVVRGGSIEVGGVFRFMPVGVQPDLLAYRMPDGVEVDLRTEDLGVAWRDCRIRMGGSVAKLGSVADTFGLLARYDRKALDRAVTLAGIGPAGEERSTTTRRPEYPATDTSLLLSGSVVALGRMVVGLTALDFERRGGPVAHVSTDSITVPASLDGGLWPCPGGPLHLPDGREAIRVHPVAEVRTACARADALLGHRGGPAWKEEVDSLTAPTTGVVLGVNKVVLGRPGGAGNWDIVRSTDADLGGHLLDPTGTVPTHRGRALAVVGRSGETPPGRRCRHRAERFDPAA